MNNKGTICSIDKSTTRMSQWVREVSRLGVAIADPVVADASRQLPITLEADVVVLDPPCTNTGTFWRSPATKWTVRPESFHQLPAEQFALLQNAARCVRKGGTLVYSTCSIFPEENERVVERFLRVNPEFEAVEASPRIGLEGVHGVSAAQRLYPHIHECNGHFILKMKYTG
jgi:16S rRNA (cytosine967-C5)-methyltransferase